LISAVTRQNAGSFFADAGCDAAPGGMNAPAATSFAEVIVVSASLRVLKLSHVAASAVALQAVNNATTNMTRPTVRQMFTVCPQIKTCNRKPRREKIAKIDNRVIAKIEKRPAKTNFGNYGDFGNFGNLLITNFGNPSNHRSAVGREICSCRIFRLPSVSRTSTWVTRPWRRCSSAAFWPAASVTSRFSASNCRL